MDQRKKKQWVKSEEFSFFARGDLGPHMVGPLLDEIMAKVVKHLVVKLEYEIHFLIALVQGFSYINENKTIQKLTLNSLLSFILICDRVDSPSLGFPRSAIFSSSERSLRFLSWKSSVPPG